MKLIAHLYGYPTFSNLDLLRQHMFATSKSDLRTLPPTNDAFFQHLLRVVYQISLYKQAHLCEPALPPLTDFGRKLESGRLQPVLMTKSSKPKVVKSISCKCKVSHCLRSCSCAKADIPCSVSCLCLGSKEMCGRIQADSDSDSEYEI